MRDNLTTMQWRFVIEYCKLLSEDVPNPNATQCAINAGASEHSAQVTASKWLSMPKVQKAIDERKEQIATAAGVTTEFVLQQWYQIATADPGELSQIRRYNCRHCWGFDHHYQWTEGQYADALNRSVEAGKPAPDGMGGFNFELQKEPCPTCPECGGLGVESVFLADTRNLKGSAKRLYAGVQKTTHGLKVMTRNQDDALRNIAKYLGMLVDKQQILGPDGKTLGAGLDGLSDAQLLEIVRISEANRAANDSSGVRSESVADTKS